MNLKEAEIVIVDLKKTTHDVVVMQLGLSQFKVGDFPFLGDCILADLAVYQASRV